MALVNEHFLKLPNNYLFSDIAKKVNAFKVSHPKTDLIRLTILVLAFLIVYILIKGIPNLNLDLFAWEYNTENVSMMPAIINTLIMTVISLLIAAPLGIFAAIYLAEYARRGRTLRSSQCIQGRWGLSRRCCCRGEGCLRYFPLFIE